MTGRINHQRTVLTVREEKETYFQGGNVLNGEGSMAENVHVLRVLVRDQEGKRVQGVVNTVDIISLDLHNRAVRLYSHGVRFILGGLLRRKKKKVPRTQQTPSS